MATTDKIKRRSARGPRRAAWRRPAKRRRGEKPVSPREEGLGLTFNEAVAGDEATPPIDPADRV